jgi:hypothetical protein
MSIGKRHSPNQQTLVKTKQKAKLAPSAKTTGGATKTKTFGKPTQKQQKQMPNKIAAATLDLIRPTNISSAGCF